MDKTEKTSTEILDYALRKVGTKRNASDRVAALVECDSPQLRRALCWSYNPYIRYGVNVNASVSTHLLSQVRWGVKSDLTIDDQEIWDLLEDLSSKPGAKSAKVAELERLFARLDMTTGHILIGILSKSLIKGVAASTVNKAFPGLIPNFGVQLSAKYGDRKVKEFPVYVEPKYDGMRAVAVVYPTGDIEFMTRTGRPIIAASYFADEIAALAKAYTTLTGVSDGVVFDGELLGETFNDSVSIFRRQAPATSGTFKVFDAVPLKALTDSAPTEPYDARRTTLEKTFKTANNNTVAFLDRCEMSPAYVAHSKGEIWRMYEKAREIGQEGVIVKAAKGLWQTKRTNDWMKIKAEETLDLKIVGGFEGEGELEGTLGGLIVDFNGVNVRVGSGFKRHERDNLYDLFLKDTKLVESGSTDFELFGNSIEVQYQEVTRDGSLRHPVYVRLRRDKDEMEF